MTVAPPPPPPPSFKRTELHVFESMPNGRKGALRTTIKLGLNPHEITFARSASWDAPMAKKPKPPEFKGINAATMNLEVFLDSSVSPTPVADTVDQLLWCTEPTDRHKGTRPSPPFVILTWGSLSTDLHVVTSVTAKYTMFTTQGVPTRAVCTLALQAVSDVGIRQNPTSGGIRAVRSHTVVGGDSLASIATNEFGRPAPWRAIAEINGIDDPMRLVVGRQLVLPGVDEIGSLDTGAVTP